MNNKTCGECCHREKTEHFFDFHCKHRNCTVSTGDVACNHFSKRYGICPECGSYMFSYEHTEDNDWQLCTCERCGCSGTPNEFLYNSVFARITASLEALAEKLIHNHYDSDYGLRMYHSTIITDKWFASYREAFSATVEKLKEAERSKEVVK